MDFSNFTNINARITAWGGIKQTAFNKKKYAAAEASWNLLSPQEIAMLDQQIPYGVEAFSFVATPTAILVYEAKTVRVIPIRDIMWIYGNVVKQTMNFIPTSKFHTLYLLARDGGTIHLARSQPVVSPRKRRLMKQSPNCRTCYSLTERELYMDIPMKSRTISRGTSPELSRWLTRNLWSLRPTSGIPYAGLIDSQCNLT